MPPKLEISEEDMKKAEEYAYAQCQNNTIAVALGWHENFIKERTDILKRLQIKRVEGKIAIKQSQMKQVKNPVMSIWLGKQYLQQSDRTELTGKDGAPLMAPMINVLPARVMPDNVIDGEVVEPNQLSGDTLPDGRDLDNSEVNEPDYAI